MKLRRTFNHSKIVESSGSRAALENSHVFRQFVGMPEGKGAIVSTNGKMMVVEPVELAPDDVPGPISPEVLRLVRQWANGQSLKATDGKVPVRLRKKYVTVGGEMTVRRRELKAAPANMEDVAQGLASGERRRICFSSRLLRDMLTAFESPSNASKTLTFEIDLAGGMTPVKVSDEMSGAYCLIMPMSDKG